MTTNSFRDGDWRVLRKVLPAAIDRYCAGVLGEIQSTILDADIGAHRRYLAIIELLRKRDEVLGRAVDDLTKSKALIHLLGLRMQGFLSEDEFGQFSEETRDSIDRLRSSLERGS